MSETYVGSGQFESHRAALANLLDQQAIRDLQNHYSFSIDDGRYYDLDDVFTTDVVADYGAAGLSRGVEQVKDICRGALDPLTSSQHVNGNHWAEVDGDEATAGCYFRVHQHKQGTPGGDHLELGGRATTTNSSAPRTAGGLPSGRSPSCGPTETPTFVGSADETTVSPLTIWQSEHEVRGAFSKSQQACRVGVENGREVAKMTDRPHVPAAEVGSEHQLLGSQLIHREAELSVTCHGGSRTRDGRWPHRRRRAV